MSITKEYKRSYHKFHQSQESIGFFVSFCFPLDWLYIWFELIWWDVMMDFHGFSGSYHSFEFLMDFLDLTWPYYLFHQLPWVPSRSWTKEDSLAARLGHRDLLALPELRELSWALASILWRRPGGSTLWLCQNSYWKWPLIVDFPIQNCDFQ